MKSSPVKNAVCVSVQAERLTPLTAYRSLIRVSVRLATLVAAMWLLPSCAGGLGGFGAAFSDSMEPILAEQLAASVVQQMPMEEDKAANAYVQRLTTKLATHSERPDLKYRAFIVDSDDVNAFTVGGGYIFLHKGLLARSRTESELAGVIAHEIGHNVGRHLTKKLVTTFGLAVVVALAEGDNPSQSRQIAGAMLGVGGGLLSLKFSRDNESEADRFGVDEMVRAGHDPSGLPSFFGVLRNLYGDSGGVEQYFASHPPLTSRIQHTEEVIAGYGPKARGLAKDSPAFRRVRGSLTSLTRHMGADTFTVAAGDRKSFAFDVDVKGGRNVTLKIQVKTRGGSGNDIKVIVTGEAGAKRVEQGGDPGGDAYVKKVSGETITVPLQDKRKYFVIFDNSFSMVSPKVVAVRLSLHYTVD
ncbi:MAG: M48 family metalloprotease [Candidatus Krumholzibacteriia bacterium]